MSYPVTVFGPDVPAVDRTMPDKELPAPTITGVTEAVTNFRFRLFKSWFGAIMYRNMDTAFRTRAVPRGGPVNVLPASHRPLPDVTVGGRSVAVSKLLDEHYTSAFLVMRSGEIVHEEYRNGSTSDSRFMSWSLGKSLVSILVGIAVDKGLIGSIDGQITSYIPELADTAYDGVTIKQALMMRAGTAYDEFPGGTIGLVDHWVFESLVLEHMRAYDLARVIGRTSEPGTKFKYASVDTAVLGWLLERATGQTLSSFKSANLWTPCGMERDGYWLMDGPPGIGAEFSAGGMNATVRDYARIGQMMLNGGRIGEKQIVSESWVEESVRLVPTGGDPLGKGYGYQWWQIGDLDAYCGVGFGGQYLYVYPETQTIIVKTSYVPPEELGTSMPAHGQIFDAIATAEF